MASVFPVYKMSKETIFILVGLGLMVFAFWFAIAYSYPENATNSTNEMLFSDRWGCGYINNMTTLEDIRECYRD